MTNQPDSSAGQNDTGARMTPHRTKRRNVRATHPTTAQVIQWCEQRNACGDALEWLRAQPGTPGQVWRRCRRGDWLAWLVVRAGRVEQIRPAVYAAADRACRRYAPRALAAQDLHEEARKLRALDPIVDQRTAADAAYAARAADAADAAADAAYAARAAYAADAAADAAYAADAADAADASFTAFVTGANAAGAAYAGTADVYAARARELATSARDIRRIVTVHELLDAMEIES